MADGETYATPRFCSVLITERGSLQQPTSIPTAPLFCTMQHCHCFGMLPRAPAQALDFDTAQVINRLLEGSLPPSLAALDPHTPMSATETSSASLPSTSAQPTANGELVGEVHIAKGTPACQVTASFFW